MKIHYFQRYHSKENVATANTMLLLSRLYKYSSDKFFKLLKDSYFGDMFEPELIFNLQERNKGSVPDATITQESFKIVVETKLADNFDIGQLERHLNSFKNESYKVLITLAPEQMNKSMSKQVNNMIHEHNKSCNDNPVIHINTTFEMLIESVERVLDERDYDMQDILEDYRDYCYSSYLIAKSDSWKYMYGRLTSRTFDFNMRENMYYSNISSGFRPHDYLGLYANKSIRAVGKITAIITAVLGENGLEYNAEFGELTEEYEKKIKFAIEDAKNNYGYILNANRYFFVDKFYETDFRKVTNYAPRGHRVFNLSYILDTQKIPTSVKEIAESLKNKTWT